MTDKSIINARLDKLNSHSNALPIRIGLLMLFVLALVAIYYFLQERGVLSLITDADKLKSWVNDLGYVGPVIIIAIMAIAVIINPIPSAPIALAAGAVYGHSWGTLYVVAGATIGAVGAFLIARSVGQELLIRVFGKKIMLGWLGSQNILMGLVFVSRLIPFLSFDLVSYGAGLTRIKTWRFILATVMGLVPASFLLTHFGGEMAAANLNDAMIVLLIVGSVTILPIAIMTYLKRT
ncbi:TVP38/TMEM64 family protein [Sedimenticola selenatireducens]|nr:VTT domain-containing protein [Sedimenticola selenatireducens]